MIELIKPMEPILSSTINSGDEWFHQIKWDGIRGIWYLNNGNVKMYTKNGNERTEFYPEISHLAELVKGKQAVIDGEIVSLDEESRPSFSQVLMRERVRSLDRIQYYSVKYPVQYIIFDILYLDKQDLRRKPLEERYDLLQKNIEKSNTVTITDNFSSGKELFNLMIDKEYEGIVSKNRYSIYTGGKKHNYWYKRKINKKMLAVIGGIRMSNNYPAALLIGIYKDNYLYPIGSVSIGLKQNDWTMLMDHLNLLKSDENPFYNNIDEKNCIYLQPKLTCWVSFLEWTNHGSLRHPKLIGFSSMKPFEADGKEYSDDGHH